MQRGGLLLLIPYVRLPARSKRNKGIFNRNEGFTELIDFPLMHEEEKADEETSNKRKKSFSLYDEE